MVMLRKGLAGHKGRRSHLLCIRPLRSHQESAAAAFCQGKEPAFCAPYEQTTGVYEEQRALALRSPGTVVYINPRWFLLGKHHAEEDTSIQSLVRRLNSSSNQVL